MPLHRDSEGISPDIAVLRRGPRAERAVDDATHDPRPDQAVAARAGCASRRGSRARPRKSAAPPKAKPADYPSKKPAPKRANGIDICGGLRSCFSNQCDADPHQ